MAAGTEQAGVVPTRRPLRSLRILVVDDDPSVLKSLRDILAHDGHTVSAAEGGQHGIDLFRYITSEEPQVVSAVTSHAVHKREVEDYAHVTLRTPSGIVFLNEASYTYPGTGGDQERKLSAQKMFLRATTSGGEGVQIVGPGRDETRRAPEGYLSGWPRVVHECLERIGRGEPPPASARDCARAVSLIFDAYRMTGEISRQ